MRSVRRQASPLTRQVLAWGSRSGGVRLLSAVKGAGESRRVARDQSQGASAGFIRPQLDFKGLTDRIDEVHANCVNRGVTQCKPHFVRAMYDELAAIRTKLGGLRAQRKVLSQEVATGAISAEEGRERGQALREEIAGLERSESAVAEELMEEALKLPNDSHPRSPIGGEENARVVAYFGTRDPLDEAQARAPPPGFEYGAGKLEPRDHTDIADSLKIVDFAAASLVAGPKFSMLKGQGALLELGLAQYALGFLGQLGFTPVLPPDIAHQCIVTGCGFQSRGDESNIYSIEGTNLCLAGTSEIALAGMHADSIVEEPSLPLTYAAFSHCFRREAGAAGRASRGLYRLHQFSKVEMMVLCKGAESAAPDGSPFELPFSWAREHSIRHWLSQRLRANGASENEVAREVTHVLGDAPVLPSDAWLEVLTGLQVSLMESLGLRGRILDMPTRELGASAWRKFDLEAWMPGREIDDSGSHGAWGEVCSASNCTDYQARRLGTKYRPEGGKPAFVHSLNATAIAVSRILVAMLETHQRPNGEVMIPPALQPLLGGVNVLEPHR
jgi:seryl-tRNA synthetase